MLSWDVGHPRLRRLCSANLASNAFRAVVTLASSPPQILNLVLVAVDDMTIVPNLAHDGLESSLKSPVVEVDDIATSNMEPERGSAAVNGSCTSAVGDVVEDLQSGPVNQVKTDSRNAISTSVISYSFRIFLQDSAATLASSRERPGQHAHPGEEGTGLLSSSAKWTGSILVHLSLVESKNS
jgi:hypothetical protein